MKTKYPKEEEQLRSFFVEEVVPGKWEYYLSVLKEIARKREPGHLLWIPVLERRMLIEHYEILRRSSPENTPPRKLVGLDPSASDIAKGVHTLGLPLRPVSDKMREAILAMHVDGERPYFQYDEGSP